MEGNLGGVGSCRCQGRAGVEPIADGLAAADGETLTGVKCGALTAPTKGL